MEDCEETQWSAESGKSTETRSSKSSTTSKLTDVYTENSATNAIWNCFYTNASSLIPKLDELKQRVTENGYHLVGITESWGKQDIKDSELHIEGYTMYRHDRTNDTATKGGGALMYVKDSLKSQMLPSLTNSGLQDSVWVHVSSQKCNLIVGVCYRITASTSENNEKLLQLLDQAVESAGNVHIMILGDFNYPTINYDNLTVNPGDKSAADFFDKTMDSFLYQNVTEYTRIRQGYKPSKLDYIFTDEENLVENIRC